MSTDMKIRIKDEEHSKLVQETAFKEGYRWNGGLQEIKNTNVPFLYLYADYKVIQHGRNEYVFENYSAVEVTLESRYHFKEVEKEVVELNGKRYLKEELEKALSLIKPLD